MTLAERWIQRHLRRLSLGQFLQRSAEWLAAFLFVFGSLVLMVKLFLPDFWEATQWLALAGVPVLFAAWWASRKESFTRTESIALLDGQLNAGGLLMTLSETPDERWSETLPRAEGLWKEGIPKVRPLRFFRYLSLPVLFAIGACFVPLREAQTHPVLKNTVGQQASKQLEEFLTSLEEASILEEEEKEEIREEIEKLAEQTEQAPLTHEKWETIDALEERLRMKLETASRNSEKANDAAFALMKAESGDVPELSNERKMQLEKNLIESLKKMAQAGAFSGTSDEFQDNLERALKRGKLPGDAKARQQLLKQLQEHLDKEAKKLAEIRKKCKDGNCPHCGNPQQGGT